MQPIIMQTQALREEKLRFRLESQKLLQEVAVAMVTCFLRWYFHLMGKGKTKKAALDSILYKVKGTSLTNSIRGDPEVVSCL